MKKNLTKYAILLTLILTTAVSFTSCKDDDDDNNSPSSKLIGTWEAVAQYETISLTFNSNGTGVERWSEPGYSDSENFYWTATDRTIRFEYSDGDYEYEDYSISSNGKVLHIYDIDFNKK
ncbi:MAG: hypothetical protein K2I64_07360 [Muribaculaceae bacterium]|nr:hypothetical protein [Muribaculaceae bacterium]